MSNTVLALLLMCAFVSLSGQAFGCVILALNNEAKRKEDDKLPKWHVFAILALLAILGAIGVFYVGSRL